MDIEIKITFDLNYKCIRIHGRSLFLVCNLEITFFDDDLYSLLFEEGVFIMTCIHPQLSMRTNDNFQMRISIKTNAYDW